MTIQSQIQRQRIQHVVDSYCLAGSEIDDFNQQLDTLLATYPSALVELSLVETLVAVWMRYPPVRGSGFLMQAQGYLRHWKIHPITSRLTPDRFFQITGLDPSPIFGLGHCWGKH